MGHDVQHVKSLAIMCLKSEIWILVYMPILCGWAKAKEQAHVMTAEHARMHITSQETSDNYIVDFTSVSSL